MTGVKESLDWRREEDKYQLGAKTKLPKGSCISSSAREALGTLMGCSVDLVESRSVNTKVAIKDHTCFQPVTKCSRGLEKAHPWGDLGLLGHSGLLAAKALSTVSPFFPLYRVIPALF